MSKLSAPMQRCGHFDPRILAGIGSVDRMERTVCGHLSFGTQAAMERHLAECHGGAEGKWTEVGDAGNQDRPSLCDCGKPRRPEWDTCLDCKRKTIQYHEKQFKRRRSNVVRDKWSIVRQMDREVARASGLCTDTCGRPAAPGKSLCLECRQYRAGQQKRWREEKKASG